MGGRPSSCVQYVPYYVAYHDHSASDPWVEHVVHFPRRPVHRHHYQNAMLQLGSDRRRHLTGFGGGQPFEVGLPIMTF